MPDRLRYFELVVSDCTANWTVVQFLDTAEKHCQSSNCAPLTRAPLTSGVSYFANPLGSIFILRRFLNPQDMRKVVSVKVFGFGKHQYHTATIASFQLWPSSSMVSMVLACISMNIAHLRVSWNRGTPKSSIGIIGFSINHPMAMSPPGRCQLRFGAHRCFEFAKSRGEGCEKGRNMPGIIRNHQNKNRVNKNQRSWRGPRDGNSNGLMIPECAGVS